MLADRCAELRSDAQEPGSSEQESDEVVVDGEARRADARGDVELAVNRAQVLGDCSLTDGEPLANLGIRQPSGNERENLGFALG